MVIFTKDLWQPYLFAASYIGMAAIAALAGCVLIFLKIPKPSAHSRANAGRPLGEIARTPRFIVAVVCGVAAYSMMNLVMTSAPLAMVDCGHSITDSTLGLQWHLLGMFAPSFITGSLITRFGVFRIMALGFATIIAAALTGIAGITVAHFWVALALLGIGWNFLFVGATTLVTQAHRPEERNKVQSFNDFLIFGTMAIGSFASGKVLATLGERKGRVSLSATAMRSLLDGIASRLEESREISRYMIGLLIFLGLLGTFWGLLDTVSAVSGVIASLTTATDTGAMFNSLRDGLQRPLGGMGTAFGTSLFGLAGSLVLGFLDLQAGQAQNRFYNDLEEWLSSMTRLGSTGGTSDEQSVPQFIQALLEQTADNLENLQRTMARFDEGRAQNTGAMTALVERLTALTDQMRTEQALISRLAENQNDLKPLLQRLSDATAKGEIGRAHV